MFKLINDKIIYIYDLNTATDIHVYLRYPDTGYDKIRYVIDGNPVCA